MYTNHLAEIQTWRTIAQLRNSHIELTWDWYTIQLRTADLLVLSQRLEEWYEFEEESASGYTVWLGQERLTMPEADLYQFYELVRAAVEKLPRRVVHWVDVEMRIEPHLEGVHNGCSYFSVN